MRILPYINEEYTTTMTPSELAEKLSHIVEPKQHWTHAIFRKKRSKPFEGEVSDTSFEIRPIIRYRNSFIPIISGQVIAVERGSVIKLEMKLHSFVKSFMVSWLGSLGIGLIWITASMIQTLSFNPLIFFPMVMWLFGYFLVKKGFNYEAIPAQTTLEAIFK